MSKENKRKILFDNIDYYVQDFRGYNFMAVINCKAADGFMMSWKPYNIFMLAGTGLLILAYDDFRKEIFAFLNRIRRILFSTAMFLAG